MKKYAIFTIDVESFSSFPNLDYLGCLPIYAKIPPSTYKICPFTKLDASLAKNTAGPAKSSGLPQRAAGVFAIIKLSLI